MAVTYVNDFSFPSDFGFKKNGSDSVPGKKHGGSTARHHAARHADGGKVSTPQPYAKGGLAKGAGQTKYPGHKENHSGHAATQGLGAGKEKLKSSKDSGYHKTTTEHTSGVQHPAFKKGGHAKRHADGGEIGTAEGKVGMGKKSSWNRDDASSPGSYDREPPKQSVKNKDAVKDKFAARDTEDATKQKGSVQRMSGWSDFKHGGKVHKKSDGGHMDEPERKAMHKDRPRNMGENPQAPGHDKKKSSTPFDYREGGPVKKGVNIGGGDRYEMGATKYKVKAAKDANDSDKGEGAKKHFKTGGYAGRGDATAKHGAQHQVNADKYEARAGVGKKSHDGTLGERPSAKAVGKHTDGARGMGTVKNHSTNPKTAKTMAHGGLSRGTSRAKNAAIHAKSHKQHSGPSAGALASLLGGSGGPPPGMGPPPSGGMDPSMGGPPPGMGGPPPGMGGPPPGAMGPPPGAGGPPPGGMAHGGGVKHVVHHHVSYKA